MDRENAIEWFTMLKEKFVNTVYEKYLEMAIEALKNRIGECEKYCDRNICISNEYNGIGCDECEVTKS